MEKKSFWARASLSYERMPGWVKFLSNVAGAVGAYLGYRLLS